MRQSGVPTPTPPPFYQLSGPSSDCHCWAWVEADSSVEVRLPASVVLQIRYSCNPLLAAAVEVFLRKFS